VRISTSYPVLVQISALPSRQVAQHSPFKRKLFAGKALVKRGG
jgi:hypothetical protein